ncbi:MAG: hypothetical protein J0I20_03700 [Chloroflexi bacterium]|nr:hypothetical protein [Chloroflexota bacterium]OJV89155.1 MAG: hypothetical protein BGO39_34650 [Chloroflexi bacterium 54-19]
MLTFVAEVAYIALYTAICCWVGQTGLRLLGVNLKGGLWFGTSLLAGITLLSGELALFSLVGLPFNGLLLYGPWLTWLVIWLALKTRAGIKSGEFFSRFRFNRETIPRSKSGATWLAAALAVICGIAVFSLLTRQFLTPLVGTDGMAIWFLKAKAFYLNGHITMAGVYPDQSHLDYPVAYPLAINTIYLMGSGYQEQPALALPGLFMLACLALIFGYTRRHLVAWQSWGLCLALISLPAFLTLVNYLEALGQADFAEGVAFLLFGVFYTLWWEEEKPAYLGGAFLGADLGANIKNEGLSFLVLALLAIGLALVLRPGLRKNLWREKGPALALAATIAAVGGWKIYTYLFDYKTDIMADFSFGKFLSNLTQETPAVLERVWDVIRNDSSYWFLGLMLLFSLIIAAALRDKISITILILTGVIGGQLLAYAITYLISPFHLVWTLDTTMFRLLGQLVPLSFFVFCIGVSKTGRWLTVLENKQKTLEPVESYSV